ncbi:MAG: hypothetical protein MI864_23035 [Pseudomonadales bacterium]|nr:hypothetical protein [Pseudomonadales bacterium]
MPQFLIASQPVAPHQLPIECKAEPLHNAAGPVNFLSAYQPYSIGPLCAGDRQLYNIFSNAPRSSLQQMGALYDEYSGDTVLALAEIMNQVRAIKELQATKDFTIGSIGAATSVYSERMNGFANAVFQYEETLMKYAHAVRTGSAPRMKRGLKMNVKASFANLQRHFAHELKVVTGRVKSAKGTPLTNVDRALNIARDSRKLTKLEIHNQAQAQNLLKFTKHSNRLGTGLVAIDFGSRIGNIKTEYKSGGNWEKEMFIESMSFAVSTGAGMFVAELGTAALGLAIAATPVGWVGLLIVAGGAAVVASGAATSIVLNNKIKDNSGDWYDQIMNWISG